jgi:hypothetical protein
MLRKSVLFGTACVIAWLVGCAGPVGKGQGESCSKQEDCSADLTCQPVGNGDYCCPTPRSASTSGTCKASGDGG